MMMMMMMMTLTAAVTRTTSGEEDDDDDDDDYDDGLVGAAAVRWWCGPKGTAVATGHLDQVMSSNFTRVGRGMYAHLRFLLVVATPNKRECSGRGQSNSDSPPSQHCLGSARDCAAPEKDVSISHASTSFAVRLSLHCIWIGCFRILVEAL